MAKLDKNPKGKDLVPKDTERVIRAEIVSPRCKVCQSPYRREIDMCLATGWSQANVIRHFNQLHDVPFNKANMSVHVSKHLRSSDAAVRRIWEARAREIGLDVDSVENFIMTIDGARDAIIYRGIELVQAGVLELDGKALLTALKDKEQAQKSQNDVAVEVLTQQFREALDAIKETVPEEYYVAFVENFEARLNRLADGGGEGRINPPLQLTQPHLEEDEEDIDGEAEEVNE